MISDKKNKNFKIISQNLTFFRCMSSISVFFLFLTYMTKVKGTSKETELNSKINKKVLRGITSNCLELLKNCLKSIE